MLKPQSYLMIDDVQLHSVKEMARFLHETPGFEIALDMGKALIFKKATGRRDFGDCDHPYLSRRSGTYETSRDRFALQPSRSWATAVRPKLSRG